MQAQTASEDTDFWRWVALATEVLGLALTLYFLWEYMPERWKIDLRRWARGVRTPFDAAEARKHARAGMMNEVLTLMTYGVPDEWVREVRG